VARFAATLAVLERRKHVHGWSLTERGERLRFVYNELDLLLVESIFRGFLLGLEPPALAAVVSAFTYEERPRDVLDRPPSNVVEERVQQMTALWEELADQEQERGVPASRPPDPGFAGTVEAWTSGMDLEELFGDDDFAAGDFVRNCRQLLDLLRQIRDAFPGIAETAAAAVRTVDRGIVAVGGRR